MLGVLVLPGLAAAQDDPADASTTTAPTAPAAGGPRIVATLTAGDDSEPVEGVVHRAQSPEAIGRVKALALQLDDFRLTAGGMISLNKWSLDLNYKHGLNNYNEGGNGNVFSRMLHIKLLYRLLKLK